MGKLTISMAIFNSKLLNYHSRLAGPEFDDMKAKGLLDVSLGKVPLLEVDGVQILGRLYEKRFWWRQKLGQFLQKNTENMECFWILNDVDGSYPLVI